MRLTKQKARQVAEADAGIELLPDGKYRAMLVSVDSAVGKKSNEPYWKWEFKITEDGHPARRLWNNTSLSDAALWKFKETFDAFGVPATTDTDELEGREVYLIVGHRTIQEGARKGEEANQVETVLPLGEDEEDDEDDDEEGGAEASDDDDDDDEDDAEDDDEDDAPPPPSTGRKGSNVKGASGAKTQASSARKAKSA